MDAMISTGGAAAGPLLRVAGVTLQYKSAGHLVTATWRVSFDVHAGDRFVLLGPSGCGKSSLLKSVGGFIEPMEGRLELRGTPIAGPGPDRMMVFQEFDQLMPWKTVAENVAFPLTVSRAFPVGEIAGRVRRALERAGLTPFRDAYPHTLSGGMKQRTAIARALAMEPAMLLMDEPFAALDALTRRQMQEQVLGLWDDLGFTMLFVTHSIEEAIMLGSRILVLSPHPGRVRAEIDVGRRGQRDEAFAALHRRIHDMLFTEQPAPERSHD